MEELCQIYIDKINFKENLQAAQEQSDLEEDEREQIISMVLESSPAKEIPKNLDKKKKSEEMSLDRVLPATNEETELSVALIKAIGVDTSAIDIFPEEKKTIPKQADEEDDEDFEEEKPDMRSVLGFLN